jgi:outer membrane receptor for ferrienterochelin and colicin
MSNPARLLALSLLSVCSLLAQTDANKSQVNGVITDPKGASIAGASVKVLNVATGFLREVKSNDAGEYRVPLLDPGVYNLSITSPAFAETKVEGVTLTVGSAARIDVNLSIQATATVIEVGAAMVDVQTTSQTATVNNLAITNLPINGRRFQDFALLTPTVQVENGTRGQISFAGQRAIYSNIMLDGADYNQPFFGGIRGGERSGSIITVPQSAIQEFQVVPSGYTAEYGRSTGGVMNTITKSGGNDIHGEAFYQIRHRDLSSEHPIFLVKPSETLQQYGGGIGGPIVKNKLFYFGAIESQNSDVPRQTVFAQLANFTPTADTRVAYDFYKSLEKPFTQTNRATGLTTKADYQMTNGDRMTFRYNHSRSNEVNAVSTGAAVNPFTTSAESNEGTEKDAIHNGSMQYTKLFSTNMVNDFRFTGSAEVRPRIANTDAPSLSNTIGTFGTRSFLSTTQDDKRWQFTDSLSITRGRHNIKLGADLNFLTAGQYFAFNQFGAFGFATSDIATLLRTMSANGTGGVNRFDIPAATYARAIGNGLAELDIKQISFFAQDSWNVTRKLKIDLGLRWEGQYNPKVEANNDQVVNLVQGVTFPLGSVANVKSIPNALNQVMPRFGFAYSPFNDASKLVVRGFSGLFYGATPMLSFSGAVNNFRTPPGDVSLSIGNLTGQPTIYQSFRAAGIDLNTVSLDKLPVLSVAQLTTAATFAAGGAARNPFANANVLTMGADFKNPRAFQGGIGFESELARGFTVGTQFHYVNTSNLLRNRNFNLGIPTVAATDLSKRPTFGARPVPTLNQFTVRESSSRSLYRAGTFNTQYRLKRFQFQAFYTLASTYSDDDNERDAGGFVYENSFNLIPEYNYSNLDIRHQFTSNGTFSLPLGFEVSGIFRARSGLPLNAIAGSDLNRDGNNNDRPYLTAGVPMERNSFRNRGTSNMDMRFMKNFKLVKEGMRAQLSVEFFNLLNADNVIFAGGTNIYGAGVLAATGQMAPVDARFMRLRLPNGNYDTNNTQVGSPRQVQFAFRFFF